MGTIRASVRWLVALVVGSAVASGIAAAVAKGRLASSGGPADDEFDVVAIYDGFEFASLAPALRRATLLAWYGGGTLDLSGATLDPAGATLSLRALFGGCQLVVPATWRVELEVTGVFGGVGDARRPDLVEADAPTLRIDGWAVFGGVGIVSAAPDLDREMAGSEDAPGDARGELPVVPA